MPEQPAAIRPSGDAGPQSDTQLSVELMQRSPAALAEVYRRHGRAVIDQARRLGGAGAAHDVAQEVFLTLWRDPARFDPSRGSLRTFLLTLTHHRTIDQYRSEQSRRRRQDRFSPASEARTSLDETIIAADDAARVRTALDSLPSNERLAIDLAYFGQHSYREVAEMLNQPEGTVKSRIRHGLKSLRSSPSLVAAVAAASHDGPMASVRTTSPPLSRGTVAALRRRAHRAA